MSPLDFALLKLEVGSWMLSELQLQARVLQFQLALRAYNPDEPRVPAGNPDGGQWTNGPFQDPAGTATDTGPTHEVPVGGQPPRDPAGFIDPQGSSSLDEGSPGQNQGLLDYVQYRGRFHDQIRDDLANYLRSKGATLETEVPITLPGAPPVTAVLDVLARNPDTGLLDGIEVKTGQDPTYTLPQSIVYPHMPSGGLVVSTSHKVLSFGITPLTPLPPIRMFLWYVPGPGAKPILKQIEPNPLHDKSQ